jgi:hypothetical protein
MKRVQTIDLNNGYSFVIRWKITGHYCGYLEIPKENLFFGIDSFALATDYPALDDIVHGGITFADFSSKENKYYPTGNPEDAGKFYLGFDAAHLDDLRYPELGKNLDDLTEDDKRLISVMTETAYKTKLLLEENATFKDVDFMLKELIRLYDAVSSFDIRNKEAEEDAS